MHIAVSDYDGTLSVNGAVSDENVTAIHAWRKAGHLFGIATGRDLSLIMHEVRRFRLPFDFLICANGAMLYDQRLKLLKRVSIPDALVRDILLHPAVQTSLHLELCSNDMNKVHVRSEKSWFRRIDAEFEEITFQEALKQRDIQQVSVAYETEAGFLGAAEALAADFKDALSLNNNNSCIDINSFGVNKLSGILDILTIQGWPQDKLLVIGDGENDILMIRHFKGFSLVHAPNKVARCASGLYRSVADMLTEHL